MNLELKNIEKFKKVTKNGNLFDKINEKNVIFTKEKNGKKFFVRKIFIARLFLFLFMCLIESRKFF